MSEGEITRIQEEIISCKKCSRLVKYREEVAKVKIRRFSDQTYWGRPVPSWGDPKASLMIIGLAPAAHGGNRTGRIFTGDRSGDWLFRGLYEVGLASKPFSLSKDDGQEVRSVYITAVAHCAPPKNRLTAEEIENCSDYLLREIRSLNSARAYLALGRVAFTQMRRLLKLEGEFYHGAVIRTGERALIASYHPSAQNTLTRRLTWEMWISVLRRAKELAGLA